MFRRIVLSPSSGFKCVVKDMYTRTSVGRQQLSAYVSLTTQFNPDDEASTGSETLVSNHHNYTAQQPRKKDVSLHRRGNFKLHNSVFSLVIFSPSLLQGG